MSLPIPSLLATHAQDRKAWMARLPDVLERVTAEWSLEVGLPYEPGGQCSWTAPVTRDGVAAALKIGLRHPEAEHEAQGLRAWAGHGAVEVYETWGDDAFSVLLLERCEPGKQLKRTLPAPEQDVVVAGLLNRLWIDPPKGHRFRPLEDMCELWARDCERRIESHMPKDRMFVDEGLALWRDLPKTAPRRVLLATDLHGDNILAAEREPWLVIDPKPYVGDPAYDPIQHMCNCDERWNADPLALANRMADLTGVDPVRLRAWIFARSVVDNEGPDGGWNEGLLDIGRRVAP